MHITKQVRALLVKKSGLLFSKLVSEAVFYNYIHNLEEYLNNSVDKSMYETAEVANEVTHNRQDDSFKLFYSWFERITDNIEDDYNKGRKLVRKLKGLQARYSDNLPYGIAVGNTLMMMYNIFLMSEGEEKVFVETYGIEHEHKLLKEYLIGIIVIDEVSEKEQELSLIELMILGEGRAVTNGIHFIGNAVLGKS